MNFLGAVLNFIVGLLYKNETVASVTVPLDSAPKKPSEKINWTNMDENVTENFTVRDCLMLHSYNRLATAQDGADFDKLVDLCNKMEEVRNILACSVNVHCMYRSEAYNQSQGIKPVRDVHSMNEACDFDCHETLTIQEVKDKLEPYLDQLNIRMERKTTTWIHIDLHSVGPSGRYFTA